MNTSYERVSSLWKIGCIISAFKHDEVGCVQAVRGWKRTYGKQHPVLVVNDKNAPMSESVCDVLRGMGCEVMESSADRKNNLNGKMFILDQLTNMKMFVEKHGLDWIFKLDSDSLHFDPCLFCDEIVKPWAKAVFPTGEWLKSPLREHNGWGLGITYTLSAEAVSEVLDVFKKRKTFCFGEDYEISTTCRFLFGEGFGLRYIFCSSGKIGVSTPWDKEKNCHIPVETDIASIIHGSAMLYFGNRGDVPPDWVVPAPDAEKSERTVPTGDTVQNPDTGVWESVQKVETIYSSYIPDEPRIRLAYGRRMEYLNDWFENEFSVNPMESWKRYSTTCNKQQPEIPDIDGKFFADLHNKQKSQ